MACFFCILLPSSSIPVAHYNAVFCFIAEHIGRAPPRYLPPRCRRCQAAVNAAAACAATRLPRLPPHPAAAGDYRRACCVRCLPRLPRTARWRCHRACRCCAAALCRRCRGLFLPAARCRWPALPPRCGCCRKSCRRYMPAWKGGCHLPCALAACYTQPFICQDYVCRR